MKRIFMFDIDGTLTPPRLPMTEEMVEMFEGFCKRNRVILVTGSDMKKVVEQVPEKIRDSRKISHFQPRQYARFFLICQIRPNNISVKINWGHLFFSSEKIID